jgi:hypothetical protein
MAESKSYDVVLLPSEDIAQKAVEASQQLSAYDSLFTLDNQHYFAHLSLYMLLVKQDDLAKSVQLLEEIAGRTPPMSLRAAMYAGTHNYVNVSYEAASDVVDLQQGVLDALNPLRDGIRPNELARLAATDLEEQAHVQKYGYVAIGSLFKPHITFTKFSETQQRPDVASILPEPTEFSGLFSRIGLFELGPYATCVEPVEIFDLSA